MAVLICKMCGAKMEADVDSSIAVCEYCGSTNTIPKEIDRKGNLYNYADFQRRNNEFDKALSAYEDILKDDYLDAEAHWGMVLSKFGVEYVLDPRTQERIPTCHRTQKHSILSDTDYLAAIENSDVEAKIAIENEAKRIDEIQTKILEISRKEEPYDIFICYKENDGTGNRTEDSLIAQDLYYELEKRGYRTFFAKKTLEKKLGDEYEPIIFAALNSAKVMVVLGTKVEYFNSVWVKNEWNRFIHMSKESHKTIIPAYRGMSPYELPAELSVFQSLDMQKIGFMQDLIDGIKKCIHGERETTVNKNLTQVYGVPSLERLIKNASTYIKLGDYDSAEEVYTTITKEYPEEYRGWWGLIVCETEGFNRFINKDEQSMIDKCYMHAKQLSSPEEFKELNENYMEYIKGLSQRDAYRDLEHIKSLMVKCDKEIEKDKKEIEKLNTEITMIQRKSNSKHLEISDLIRQKEVAIKNTEERRFYKKLMISLGFLSFICSILGQGNSDLMFMLLITAILLVFLGSRKPSFDMLSSIEKESKKDIQAAENEKNEYKTQFDADISEIEKTKKEIKDDFLILTEGKEACQKYVNLGEDKISELFFSRRCKTYGIEIDFDNMVLEYREAAYACKSYIHA